MPGTFSPPPRVSDPDMHHGTCVTHVHASRDRYQAVSFEVGGGENVPGIPRACATHNLTYLVRGPWTLPCSALSQSSYTALTTCCFWFNFFVTSTRPPLGLCFRSGFGNGKNSHWLHEPIMHIRARFLYFFGVSSGCTRPITGQVTSANWPVIGWA